MKMEESSFSLIQNTSQIFWKLKVHYHVQKKPLLVPVLKQINPVRTLPSYFFRTSGVPRNFVREGGSTNSVEDRENGDLGPVAPS